MRILSLSVGGRLDRAALRPLGALPREATDSWSMAARTPCGPVWVWTGPESSGCCANWQAEPKGGRQVGRGQLVQPDSCRMAIYVFLLIDGNI